MGWSYPDISLEDLMKLIKGFVDILILASGYQSSGRHAHWDAHGVTKAFQWGLFFENVCRRFRSLEGYHDCVKELDTALSELTSNPSFPKGLAHLSFTTLSTARDFVLQHFIHTMPLRDAHLGAFLNGVVEMDLDGIFEVKEDCFRVNFEKLKLLGTTINPFLDEKGFKDDPIIGSPNIGPSLKVGRCGKGVLTELTVQELLKRQLAVSCIASLESGLDIFSRMVRDGNWNENYCKLSKERINNAVATVSDDELVDFATWNCWKSKNLSYLLSKRTVRLVSGASMIFSAPKIQWEQMFQRMNISLKSSVDDFSETIELLLLGCVTSKWTQIVEHFISFPYLCLTTLEQYNELRNILLERSQTLHHRKDIINSKERDIMEYLAEFIGYQLHPLWTLSPVLAAVAIPSWSSLFGSYLNEIDAQFKGEVSLTRCCSCTQERKEHSNCELAERVWCLYAFHVSGSHLMLGSFAA